MATAPMKLEPPTFDPPIVDYPSGVRHSQAWTEHNQAIVDRLTANSEAIAAVTAGVTDGSNAAAGEIGEFQTATSGAVALTTATPADTATLSLSAGDWEVWGAVFFSQNLATQVRQVRAWVSDVSATPPGDLLVAVTSALFVDGADQVLAAPRRRISLASPAVVYLGAQAIFGVSTSGVTGTICARRVR